MKLVSRDLRILWEVERWRFSLARQIMAFTDFQSKSALYRRLKLLVDNGYLKKKRYIYGIPALYNITPLGYKALAQPVKNITVSLGTIEHELAVIDTYLFLKDKYHLNYNDFKSERQLRIEYAKAKHYPDIVFSLKDNLYCVEIEFSLKNATLLERNIKENYLNYEKQLWIIKKEHTRLFKLLDKFKTEYPNIEIILCEEISLC